MLRFTLVLVSICFGLIQTNPEHARHINEVLRVLDSPNYNRAIRPYFDIKPVPVNMSIHVISISEVCDHRSKFKIDAYIRHIWTDPRLTFPIKYGMFSINLDDNIQKKLWSPDTFVNNGIETKNHLSIINGEQSQFWKLKHDGEIFTSRMVELMVNCHMNFQKAPFDSHICTVEFESYGHSMSDVIYQWRGPASLGVSFGEMFDTKFHASFIRNYERTVSLSTGKYSQLFLEFRLSRNFQPFIMIGYIPTFLLVALSWIPLWLGPKTSITLQFRIIYSLLLLLAQSAVNYYVLSQLPMTSYHKAIDCYLGIAITMILATLINHSVVAVRHLSIDRRSGSKKLTLNDEEIDSDSDCNWNSINRWTRWIIPAVFLVFNLAYIIRILIL